MSVSVYAVVSDPYCHLASHYENTFFGSILRSSLASSTNRKYITYRNAARREGPKFGRYYDEMLKFQRRCSFKAAFHDTNILARILARTLVLVSWNAAFRPLTPFVNQGRSRPAKIDPCMSGLLCVTLLSCDQWARAKTSTLTVVPVLSRH